jgi:hypothetical protein
VQKLARPLQAPLAGDEPKIEQLVIIQPVHDAPLNT